LKNLGHVILKLGHAGEGLHLLRRAIQLAPDDPDAHYTLGNVLMRMERLQEALNSYARVRELQPDAARAYFAPANVLLMNGQYKEGWSVYESRFDMSSYRTNVRDVHERLWDGGALDGRRLLVHVEQGFGDTLQFIRYVPLIQRLAGDGKIFLVCEPELFGLLETVEGVDEIYRLGSDTSVTYDVQVPLLSLPHRFATTLETIPNTVPYIKVPPGTKARIRRRKGVRLTVAFVWAGRPTHSDDRFRSCPLNWFAALFDMPGIDFYSIQWGPRAGELTPYQSRLNVTDMTDKLTSFAETAAIIEQVDLVISIDIAVAHLAVRWASRSGLCCHLAVNGAGCFAARTRPGIRRCDCFASKFSATGGRCFSASRRRCPSWSNRKAGHRQPHRHARNPLNRAANPPRSESHRPDRNARRRNSAYLSVATKTPSQSTGGGTSRLCSMRSTYRSYRTSRLRF